MIDSTCEDKYHQMIKIDAEPTGLAFSNDARKLFVSTVDGILEFDRPGLKNLLDLCVDEIRKYCEKNSNLEKKNRKKKRRKNVQSSIWNEQTLRMMLPNDLIDRLFPSDHIKIQNNK